MVDSDNGSLASGIGRVIYTPGQRVEAPGNGIYVAVSGGLDAGGVSTRIALLRDMAGPTNANAPAGVICYRSAFVVAIVDGADLWEAYCAALAEADRVWDAARAEANRVWDAARAEAWAKLLAAVVERGGTN